ncbi:hypothetical protein ACFC8N_41040 [Streptomyces sp. NPDC055966]
MTLALRTVNSREQPRAEAVVGLTGSFGNDVEGEFTGADAVGVIGLHL